MRRQLLTWTECLAGWTLVAPFFATQNYVTYSQYGNGEVRPVRAPADLASRRP